MPQYVAFLRAINVGGRFVKMAVLAQHVRELGHADVQTYINSGNVLFRSGSRNPLALAAAIESGLAPRLGFETQAFVRTAAQVQSIAARGRALTRPELADVNVGFLSRPLDDGQLAELQALRSAVDDFVVEGTEVYWLGRVKQSESKFSNALFERRVKAKTTFRRAQMLQGLAQVLQDALR